MKSRLLFFCICLQLVVCIFAQQETFLQANKLYENKEYKAALDLYNSIEKKGVATWYNMGNCAFKLGDFGIARAYWQCAQRGANKNELDAILSNISVVNEKIGISETESSWHRTLKLLLNRINYFSLLFLQLLFLFSWFLLVRQCYLTVNHGSLEINNRGFFFIKNVNHGKKYRTLSLIFLLVCNLIFIFALYLKYNEIQYKGIVMKENVAIFAGPNEQFHVLNTLPIASEVTIIESQKQWCKVQHSKGCGWILSDSITVI